MTKAKWESERIVICVHHEKKRDKTILQGYKLDK